MAVHRITREDLLAQQFVARKLDLSSRKRVLTDLSGAHLSGFRGRGMEFEEHRRYVAGDEIRSIDWRVTARTGQTHVRTYREERERPVIIAVDLRSPMWFASRGCFKSVLAARAAACFAWAASANSDRVGGLCLHQHHSMIRPAGGRRGALGVIRMLCDAPQDSILNAAENSASSPKSNPIPPLHRMVEELRQLAHPGALIVLLSDFHDLDPRAEQGLHLIARHCELVLGFVSDPLERQAPKAGQYPARSAATDQATSLASTLDTRSHAMQQRWRTQFLERQQRIQKLAVHCRARSLDLRTDGHLEDALCGGHGHVPHVGAAK